MMGRLLSLYFDGTIVQAVTARAGSRSLTVEEALTFPLAELPDYLGRCRFKKTIISCNPPLLHQDIINLPPAAEKHYQTLVRNEITRLRPELASYSFFYQVVGETIIESKPYRKIATFCFEDDFLYPFLATLTRFGITATRIYPAPYTLHNLALTTCADNRELPRIFIAALPGEKLLLVSENNQLEFARKIATPDSTIVPDDAYNINMTIDYCSQSLRLRPTELVIINQPDLPEALAPLVSAPLRSHLPPLLTRLPPHLAQQYAAPISAIIHAADRPRETNVVPREYAAYKSGTNKVATATAIVAILACLVLGKLFVEYQLNRELSRSINTIRTELGSASQELSTFKQLDKEVAQLNRQLEAVNRHNSSLNPAVTLASLNLPDPGTYAYKSVSVQQGQNGLTLSIDGAVNSTGFSTTQALFEKLLRHVGQLQNCSVTSNSIDMKTKAFKIQALIAPAKKATP